MPSFEFAKAHSERNGPAVVATIKVRKSWRGIMSETSGSSFSVIEKRASHPWNAGSVQRMVS